MFPRLIDSAIFHVNPSADAPESDAVSADRLSDIVQGLNDIVSGLADEKRFNDADDRRRSSLTQDERAHYALYFRPPQPGSFALPFELYDTRDNIENQPPLFPDRETSFKQVADLLRFANDGDREAFYAAIGSPVVASKIEKGIDKLVPRGDETASLVIGGSEELSMPLKPSARENVLEWSSMYEGPFTQELVVTISSVDFDDNALKVKLASSRKKFKAPLSDELSSVKLDDLREKSWKILCDVLYTPNGAIAEIEAVKDIEELVLRKLTVSSFEADGKTVEFSVPLEVEEDLDETGSLFVVEVPSLDIYLYSEYQSDVMQCLRDELANKWEWLVCAPDEELTARALEVKRNFQQMVSYEVG